MKVAIVIPARMASTRFPGKPLADLAGKPMIQWVWERAIEADAADRIVVATPDESILAAARGFGAEAELTRMDHPSGTDRIAELIERIDADVFVNVQGDEPLLPPSTIRAAARALVEAPEAEMASVWCPCRPDEEEDPSVVKVVTSTVGDALYFSRWPIPYPRNERTVPLRKHLGLYAYRRELLDRYRSWTQTPLEQTESLEQLRFLENGVRIRMVEGAPSPVAVDTPEQAVEAAHWLSGERRVE